MWRVLVFCQWAICTVLLIVSRLRQSRVSTASFSVVTKYIKTIALFLLGARPPPLRFLCVLLGGAPPSPAVTSQLSLLLLYSFSGLGSCLPLPHTSQIPVCTFFILFNYFYPVPHVVAVWRVHACLMSTGYERICARRPYIRRFAMAKSGGLRRRPPTEYSISWRKPVEHNLPPGFGDTNPASCASTCHRYFCLLSTFLFLSLYSFSKNVLLFP